MSSRPFISPHFTKLLQLTATLLTIIYITLIGGSFDATLRFRVQLVNALAAGIIVTVWLAVRLGQRRRLESTGLELPLGALVISQWIAMFTSAQPRLSLEVAVSTIVWAVAFVILCDLLASGWPSIYFINALLITAFIITAEALWEVAGWYRLWAELGQLPPVAFRLTGFLGHPNLTAAALNLLLPLVVAKLISAPNMARRLALGGLGVAMLIAEFFCSSRAGWIAGAAALSVMALLLGWDKRKRVRGWAAVWQSRPWPIRIGLVVIGISVVALGGWLLARQSAHATHGSLLYSRQDFWLPAWKLFVAHPFTGAGPDLYPWYYPLSVSVPPAEVILHAHSMIFQLLSGSGLIGAGAVLILLMSGGALLWRLWRDSNDKVLAAAYISSLLGMTLHHVFDYFFGAPTFIFLVIVVSALAIAPRQITGVPSPKRYSVAWLILPILLATGMTAYMLRSAALNDKGLQLATQNQWAEAAQVFRHAADIDPGMTLYWEEAAQAFAREGDIEAALPLWKRAVHDDPYWALSQATIAVLSQDSVAMEPALALAPESHLFELNLGALAETTGDAAAARTAYLRAISLRPATRQALFWQQTSLRISILTEWQATQPADDSALARGWAALEAGNINQAHTLFDQARRESPLNNEPYRGLARAYWASGDEAQAEYYLRVGQNIPTTHISQTLDFKLLEGDWAEAHQDLSGAMNAYEWVFFAFNDYTSDGPGTYGYPWRSWVVYHHTALPSDIVPQFIHADITSEMDVRFAKLARWHIENGEQATGCYILARVYHEAPASESGNLWRQLCP